MSSLTGSSERHGRHGVDAGPLSRKSPIGRVSLRRIGKAEQGAHSQWVLSERKVPGAVELGRDQGLGVPVGIAVVEMLSAFPSEEVPSC